MSVGTVTRRAPVAVVGGGAWGTALANVAASTGHSVVLWLRDPDAAAALASTRTNARYLPGIRLHDAVQPTGRLDDLEAAGAVLLVTPAQAVRDTARAISGVLRPEAPLVVCAKGIERGTGRFLSEVVAEARPGAPVAALSGPSFADDVARGLPTAVTLASRDEALAAALAAEFAGPAFRIYHGTDVRGVEIGGAAKNVLAIAAGAVIGRGLGDSAKAAVIARGFAELLRFAAAYGGQADTLMGLSGLGDLVLTCSSTHSRNFAFGERLGRGASLGEASGGKLAEGAFTAGVLAQLARARRIEMPITEAVDALLAGRWSMDQAVDALMTRPIKREH